MFRTDVNIIFQSQPNGDLRPAVEAQHTFNNTLIRCLQNYWRWCAEGKPPYQHLPTNPKGNPPGLTPQYYYDSYHEHIAWVQPQVRGRTDWIHGEPPVDHSKGYYRYSIQTSDSPDGDTWRRGAFRLVNTYHGMTLEHFQETDEQLKN